MFRANFVRKVRLDQPVSRHRKYAPGKISSPGGSGLRIFSLPGDYAWSRSQGWGSAPRTKTLGMRQQFASLQDLQSTLLCQTDGFSPISVESSAPEGKLASY